MAAATVEEIRQQVEEQSTAHNLTRDHFIGLANLAAAIADVYPPPRRGVVFEKMLDHILGVEKLTVQLQLQQAAMQSMRQPTIVEAAGPIPKAPVQQ